MSSSVSTTAAGELGNLLPSIVAEALFVASERSIMRGLVKNYTLPMGSGKTIKVPVYPLQSAAGLTEGEDLTGGNIQVSSATLTVSEVGIMTKVTDLARMTSASNVVADVGRLFGEAIARKIDTDLTGLFTGFGQTVGGNTTAATAAYIFQAIAKLKASGVPSTDLAIVLHPQIAYDLKSSITSTFAAPASAVGNSALEMGFIGMLAGVPVYETSNFATPGTAGDYIGGAFHRDALGLAMLQDIRLETQRDASLRADEIVATAVYGVGSLYDGYGVGLSFDSSIA